MRPGLLAAAVVGVWLAPAGLADDSEGPGRGVARISVINGDVSVRRGDSGDWVAAAPNAPLVVQDRVLTGAASRAEVQFDYANFARLTSGTELRLTELEYRRYQMQVAQGTVTFRVLRDSDADVEVSTPAVSIRPQKRGTYRITVRENGETEITVRSGEVEVFTPTGVERLRSGKTMVARSTGNEIEVQLIREIPEDAFDQWSVRRDRDLERSGAYRYVHRDVYGAEDLDHHGVWVSADSYGWVWRPRVHIDWAPYRHGRWVWVDWYGWTWVSYDPWGWAPYHYGRWFHHARHGWCWYPGGYHSRHYWRPALVAFFGIGSVRVGFGFGRVGWVPLAPYEPYYPWYGRRYYGGYRQSTYIDNSVNISNNINITNIYRNSRVRNAVTAVDGGDFARGRASNIVRVSDDDFRQARLVRGQVPVTPERESLRLADREARAIGRESGEGRFYSRRPPAAVERVTFDEQRQGLERISRRAASGEAGATAAAVGRGAEGRAAGERRGTDAAAQASSAGTAAGQREGAGVAMRSAESAAESRGWRRFGEPSGGRTDAGTVRDASAERRATGAPARSDASAESRGWRRFGDPDSAATPPATDAGRTGRGTSDGWRRFGEPAGGVAGGTSPERSVRSRENARETRSTDGSGARQETSPEWRRLGEGRTERPSATREPRGREPQSDGNWRRFGDAPRDSGEPRLTPRGGGDSRRSRPETYEAPRMERTPRSEPRGDRQIQISPPVVRERAPRDSGGFGRSGGDAPRVERREGGFGGGMPRGGGEVRSMPRGDTGGGPRSDGGGGGRVSGGRGGRDR